MEDIVTSLVSQPFGTFAALFQLLAIFWGGPSQIWKLRKEKKTTAFSLPMFLFPALSSCNWIINATKEVPNPSLLISQVPAVIVSTIIVGQLLYYRHRSPVPATSPAK